MNFSKTQTCLPVRQASAIQKALLAWFKKHQRPLPWRKKYDPYHVWISEIMLQQTQVKTALPYFDRWIKRLPTIESVAEAKEETILKLWEGLGYYSRARNLHKAAKIIAKKYNGQFPGYYNQILELPGIGRYTAGAISSIAFNQNTPVVDGNVIRVLARLLNYTKNTRTPESEKQMWKWAQTLLPKNDARNFNQAMMELGALVCTPKNPKCTQCPLNQNCAAYAAGTQEALPNRGPKAKKIELRVAVGIIKKDGKILIQKRPTNGLMGGLWEFPGGKIEPGETPQKALKRELKEELGITVKNIKPFAEIRHAYTQFKVRLQCFSCDYDGGKIKLTAATHFKWTTPKAMKRLPFPAANVLIIEKLN